MLTKTVERTLYSSLTLIGRTVILLVCFYFFHHHDSFAQKPEDRAALWKEYQNATHDTIKVLRLLDLGYTYLRTNPDSAELLDKKALDLADSLIYIKGKASSLHDLGLIEWARGKYPEALEKIKSAYTLYESLGNKVEMAKCLNNIGYMYYENGQYPEALENHKNYLSIVKQKGDRKREAGALHNIGMVLQAKGDYLEAMDFYFKSVTVKKELGDSARLSNTLDALGDIFFELKDYSLAYSYYQRGFKIREKEGNKLGMVVSLYNIGRNYKEEEKFEAGLTIFKQGQRMAEELKNPILLAYHMEGIGSIYKKTGQYEQALNYYEKCLDLRDSSSNPKGHSLLLNEIADLYIQLEEWDQAYLAAKRAYDIAFSLQAKAEMKDAALYLSRIYSNQGKFESAYQLLAVANELKDSLFNSEKNREIAVSQVRHEREQMEDKQEKLRQAAELLSQRKFNTLLMFLLLVILLLFFILFLAFRQRKRTNKQLLQKNQELSDKKQNLEKLNSQLKATNQKLKLAGQKLQQFTFAASHDLKESIRSVTSFSQLLEKKIKKAEQGYPAWFTYLEFISSSGKRMDKILVDLLSYINLGAKSSDFVPINLNEVIHDIQVKLQGEIIASGAHLVVSEMPHLQAHPNLIEQLFLNLVENAIKYRQKDVPLKIEIGTERDENGQLTFFVKDNGIGIENRYFGYIFEPFKRLHDRNLSGSGLGLSICKNIVHLYDGAIYVDSWVDQGSVFRFTLPKAKAEMPVKELVSENIS